MLSERETFEKLSAASDVKMSPKKQQEIWYNIEREWNNVKPRKNKVRRKIQEIKTVTAAAVAMLAIVGGGIGYEMHNTASTTQLDSTGNNMVTHDILADSSLPGYSGQRLQLVDVKGKYVNDTTPGPFEGNNWTGKFELRVVGPTGAVLSTFQLPSFYNQFTEKFQFHFADYNGNGLSDFALGQYADSNGYNYELFEIAASGIKQLKTTPAQIFAVDHSYSPVFSKVAPNAFLVEDYNNATAKYEFFTFVWKNGESKIDNAQTFSVDSALYTPGLIPLQETKQMTDQINKVDGLPGSHPKLPAVYVSRLGLPNEQFVGVKSVGESTLILDYKYMTLTESTAPIVTESKGVTLQLPYGHTATWIQTSSGSELQMKMLAYIDIKSSHLSKEQFFSVAESLGALNG